MTQLITPLLATIDASDEANHALSQGIIKGITEEGDIYKTAFEKLAEELMKRDEYIVKLRQKLTIQVPPLPPSQKAPLLTPTASQAMKMAEPSEESLLTSVSSISQADETNEAFLQKIIKSCEQRRDLYKAAFEGLDVEIEKRDQEIQRLKQLEEQAQASKKRKDEGLSSVDALAKKAKNVKTSPINNDEKEQVIQNLTLMLYQEKKKATSLDTLSPQDQKIKSRAEKDISDIIEVEKKKLELEHKRLLTDIEVKNLTQDLTLACYQRRMQMNDIEKLSTLSPETISLESLDINPDIRALAQAALDADATIRGVPKMALESSTEIQLIDALTRVKSLLKSLERNVLGKEKLLGAKEKIINGKASGKSHQNIALASAETTFAQFYSKLEMQRHAPTSNPEEIPYSKFPFSTIGFLAGQICSLQKTLLENKDKLDRSDPVYTKITKELRRLNTVQDSFAIILSKCRLTPKKYS